MLVLSRRLNERIEIETPEGRKITVVVVDLDRRGKVRIGIQADRDVAIFRQELLPIQEKEK